MNIPAIIVEHCYVDHAYDVINLQSNETLREFGERDARAVAKYFGLTSTDNQISYSDYTPLAVPVPQSRMYQDTTAPVCVNATLLNVDKSKHLASYSVTAADNETSLLYYSYSMDNGLTWSTYQTWSSADGAMTILVNIPLNSQNSIIFKVLNQYDLATISNVVTF